MSRPSLAALSGLLVGLAVVMAVWLVLDRRPPAWDHANHLERALTCHRLLTRPGSESLRQILAMSSFYPPLVPCAAGLLYFVFPVSPMTSQAVVFGFLVVGVLAIFGVGRRLLDERAALLAAFLFATAPFVVLSLLEFQLDLPLAAMVALMLYALVRAEGFTVAGWSIGAGAVLGVGMVTKPPFGVYVLPPLLLTAWTAARAQDRAARLWRFLAALALAAVILLPWYGPRLLGLPMQVINRSFKQAAESGHAPALSVASLLFYPGLLPFAFGPLAAALLVWGIARLHRARPPRALLWSALLPFAGFLVIQNKNLRYVLPLLPAAALTAAAGISLLGPAWRRRLTAASLVLGVVQVSSAAFESPPPRVGLLPVQLIASWPPDNRDWRHREILDVLVRESLGRSATVAVVPNMNVFSLSNFRYEVAREGLPFKMRRAWERSPLGVDFVIAKTGEQGPLFSQKPGRIMAAFGGGDPWLASIFPVIAEFQLPDGSHGMVRARRVAPVQGIGALELAALLPRAMERLLADHVRETQGLNISADYEADDLLRGRARRVLIAADSALVGEFARNRAPLRLSDARIEVEGLLFHPQRLAETEQLEALDVRSVKVHRLRVSEADLGAFLRAQKGLQRLDVRLEAGVARIRFDIPGPDLSGRLRVVHAAEAGPVALGVDELRLGTVPVPGLLVDWVTRHFDPASRLRRLPIAVMLGDIRIVHGSLEVRALDRASRDRLE